MQAPCQCLCLFFLSHSGLVVPSSLDDAVLVSIIAKYPFPTNELVLAFMVLPSSSLPGLKRALRDTSSDYKTMYLLNPYA
jgi:hypothetical protein